MTDMFDTSWEPPSAARSRWRGALSRTRSRIREREDFIILLFGLMAATAFGAFTYWVGIGVEQRRADMTEEFAYIKATILAHAMTGVQAGNEYGLPCPDLDGNGRAAYSCGPNELEGGVPWQTLGIDREETINAWGVPLVYKIDRPDASVCEGNLPRTGGLILTRQFNDDATRTTLQTVFVLQSLKRTSDGRANLVDIDGGTSSLFLGLCQNQPGRSQEVQLSSR